MNLFHDLKKIENNRLNAHLYHMGWSAFFQEQLKTKGCEEAPARVVGVRKNFFQVSQGKEEVLATIAGNLINNPEVCYPAVGDWVLIRESIITSVLSRKNVLSRKKRGRKNRKKSEVTLNEQVIAANLDTTFIVCGLDRDFNLRRIERYITLVSKCGITPAVILTKADLHQNPESALNEVASIAFGIPIHLISADDNDSLSCLAAYLSPGQTVALIGSSGAGKSTLINRLYGDSIRRTCSVSDNLGKGKHTTTTRDLIVLPSGGMLIDNPGIREIAFVADHSRTESAFPEIEKLALSCKFPDCSHTHEPGCTVLEAISTGEITLARLRSFQKIQSELIYFSHPEKKGTARVENERWRGVAQTTKAMKKRRKKKR